LSSAAVKTPSSTSSSAVSVDTNIVEWQRHTNEQPLSLSLLHDSMPHLAYLLT